MAKRLMGLATLTVLIACCLGAAEQGSAQVAQSQPAATTGPKVTLMGTMLCDRQCIATLWDHRPTGPEHVLVLYAFDGTAEVKTEVDSIMREFWPGETLDADQAQRLQDEFTGRTKYYLTPSDLVNKEHRENEYSTHSVAVTGTISQHDGRKWIDVESIREAKFAFPAKMLTPDKPMIMPGGETMTLKITDTLSMKCVKVPPGRFFCGAPFYEVLRFQDEFPHMVTLTKPYFMAETLVTQEMFEAVMGSNASTRVPIEPYKGVKDPGFNTRFRHLKPDQGRDFAVENTTWAEVQEFCSKVSERNGGVNVRVPTQAEWEWAARVGTSSPVFHEKYIAQRTYAGDTEGRCEPVKKHSPNAWGIYDMVKSGWEWVSDYKADNIRYDAVDPVGPPRNKAANHGSGPLRRMEGGAYYGDTHLTLHGAIDEKGDGEEGICVFRVVVDVPETAPAPAATMPTQPVR